MGIADDVNREIIQLWYEPVHGLASRQPRMPLVYPELRGRGLVFVGLNPSFSEDAFATFLSGPEWADFDAPTFYAWRDRADDFDVARGQRVERAALDSYDKHYGPFAKLAATLSTHWDHLDLFLLRETKQKTVFSQVSRGGARGWTASELNGFGRAQLDLCVRLLERLAPEILVVANAAASRLLNGALGGSFDSEQGHHHVRLGNRLVPAFFSSMWTQGAIDTFSLERLHWQIERAHRARRTDL